MDVKQKYFTTSGARSEQDWALTDYVTKKQKKKVPGYSLPSIIRRRIHRLDYHKLVSLGVEGIKDKPSPPTLGQSVNVFPERHVSPQRIKLRPDEMAVA